MRVDIIINLLSLLQGSELCSNPDALRRELHAQLKRRLIDNERVGHMEDLLICTLLDPRYASQPPTTLL